MTSLNTQRPLSDVSEAVVPAATEPPALDGRSTPEQPALRVRLGRRALLPAILLAALLARLWDIAAQLPAMYHPDEPTNIRLIEHMVHTGDFDPHFFDYPSLFYYLQELASIDGPVLRWFLPGKNAVGPVSIVMGTSYAPSVWTVLAHRALTVAFGVAVVWVVWAIARRVFGGLLAPAVAAILTAVSPNLIEHSEYVTPDMLAVLMMAVAVLASLAVLQTGSMRAHLVAGLCVGLSVSAKYNAAFVAVAVVAAAVARVRRTGWSPWPVAIRLALSGATAAVGFCLTTPYALVDRAAFLQGIERERAHYATGHPGMQGDTTHFYLSILFREEWPITVLALVGIVAALAGGRGYRRVAAVLLAFPAVYVLYVFSMPVRNDRTILVVLPVLAVFAGYSVRWLREVVLTRFQRPAGTATGVVLALGMATAVALGLPSAIHPTAVNSAQAHAANWVAAHVPAGDQIVVESYSPWLDRARNHVIALPSLIAVPLPEGTRYVVASRTMFGRWTEHPDQFPLQAAAYKTLFGSLQEVREFHSGENSVRIYRVPGA